MNVLLLKRHIPFLKTVLYYSLTAFGGPQAHYGMLLHTFVRKKNYVTENELLDFNSFCNMLPGASSTQLLTLIGYKRGGVWLATMTLFVWVLPAAILMSLLSFIVVYKPGTVNEFNLFQFVKPMAVGFMLYASVTYFKLCVNNTITRIIAALVVLACILLFRFPWSFPLLMLAGGVATSFSKKRFPPEAKKPQKIRWANIWLFVLIFIIAGVVSELARTRRWKEEVRQPINLFENSYRMGSLVFGGGQVLIPMMESQFVSRATQYGFAKRNPEALTMSEEHFYTGAGIVRAIPGPVFSISAYNGGILMQGKSVGYQLLGCFIATVGIFLPSSLLVLFFFPIWSNLKKHVAIKRALEGINAAVAGIIIGAFLYMSYELCYNNQQVDFVALFTILITGLLLFFTRIPAPVIVFVCLALGLLI
jgi:chromate transporter